MLFQAAEQQCLLHGPRIEICLCAFLSVHLPSKLLLPAPAPLSKSSHTVKHATATPAASCVNMARLSWLAGVRENVESTTVWGCVCCAPRASEQAIGVLHLANAGTTTSRNSFPLALSASPWYHAWLLSWTQLDFFHIELYFLKASAVFLPIVRPAFERVVDGADDVLRMWLTPVKLCIQVVCPRTGKLLESRTINSTSLAYCLDEDDRRMLVVGEGKDCREFPVQGGVRVITRFATEGKATLQLIKRNTMLLISGADPDALQEWCRSLMSGGASRKAEMLAPQAQRQRQELEFAKRPLSSRSPGFANSVSPSHAGKKARPRMPGSPQPPPLSPAAREQLTEEQQAVLSAALSGRSLFFTGGAGTGKSFLLRQIMQRMPAATTFATASTGVAACQIGGTTIHFWAGVGAGDRSVAECASMASRRRGAQWAAARCLIIDEISMLDASFFEKLEAVARRVRNNQKPFGGLQLILSGDFFQLPPVSRDGFRFAFEAESWARCVPQLVELTTVFRQSDPAFVAALNEVLHLHLPLSLTLTLSLSLTLPTDY